LTRRGDEELDRTVRGQSETTRRRLESDRVAMLGFAVTGATRVEFMHSAGRLPSIPTVVRCQHATKERDYIIADALGGISARCAESPPLRELSDM
jgi:hypothetical protein